MLVCFEQGSYVHSLPSPSVTLYRPIEGQFQASAIQRPSKDVSMRVAPSLQGGGGRHCLPVRHAGRSKRWGVVTLSVK